MNVKMEDEFRSQSELFCVCSDIFIISIIIIFFNILLVFFFFLILWMPSSIGLPNEGKKPASIHTAEVLFKIRGSFTVK